MLTIKRVPTVVSNYQEEAEDFSGCGRKCLGKCCLPVSLLPLYAFMGEEGHGSLKRKKNEIKSSEDSELSFNSLLLGQWEERTSRGLFRYDVTLCDTKVIPGKFGFVAQLNEGRHLKKRPTEFRVDKVLQPFDPNKFNFTKVGQEEVLFRFEERSQELDLSDGEEDSNDSRAWFFWKSAVSPTASPNVIAINVSPIEYGHVLLIPRVSDCLPQRIDEGSLLLALNMAAEAANPFFRVGYNSLGAFATINHLHFQAYYLNMPFPVEKAPVQRIPEKITNGVKISKLLNYPVRGLVFRGGHTLKDLSVLVSTCCICLQDNNIPYNLFIADSGRRVFLFPQCYAEKQALGEVDKELLDTQVNPAVWEISGHMVLKRKEDFEGASEDYARRLLEVVSLSEERFKEVTAYLMEAMKDFILHDAAANSGDEEICTCTTSASSDHEEEGEEALFQLPASRASLSSKECVVLQ